MPLQNVTVHLVVGVLLLLLLLLHLFAANLFFTDNELRFILPTLSNVPINDRSDVSLLHNVQNLTVQLIRRLRRLALILGLDATLRDLLLLLLLLLLLMNLHLEMFRRLRLDQMLRGLLMLVLLQLLHLVLVKLL